VPMNAVKMTSGDGVSRNFLFRCYSQASKALGSWER
jgi:hypothetical protein